MTTRFLRYWAKGSRALQILSPLFGSVWATAAGVSRLSLRSQNFDVGCGREMAPNKDKAVVGDGIDSSFGMYLLRDEVSSN